MNLTGINSTDQEFIKMWADNYALNLSSKIFDSSRSKPLAWIKNNSYYQKCPVILVAAGPSLEKNISLLKEVQNKAVTVCADIVMPRLIEEGIKPDFVVTIDPQGLISHYMGNCDTSDLTYVLPTTGSPETIKKWKGRFIFFNQTDEIAHKKEWLYKITKPTQGFGSLYNKFFVGATSLQLASFFTPSAIGLVGFDFAFEGDKTYCRGIVERKLSIFPEEHRDEERKKELRYDLQVKTPDGTLFSTGTLHYYKEVFKHLCYKMKLNVINCTEGGILYEIPKMTLATFTKSFLNNDINKVDVFKPQKRKRR